MGWYLNGNLKGATGAQGPQGDQGPTGATGPAGLGPTGTVSMFAGSAAPAGFLLCDGATVSRSTYAGLFAVIGSTYGAGDGSTTFALPNLKGRVPVGVDTAQAEFNVLGETGGAKTHTLTVAEMPSHTHGIDRHDTGADQTSGANRGYVTAGGTNDLQTHAAGGGAAHNNLQPYLALNYIIKT